MVSDIVVMTRSASLSSIGLLSFSHCILTVGSVVNNAHSKVATSPAVKYHLHQHEAMTDYEVPKKL